MDEEDKDNINTDNKEDGTENGEKQSQGELTPEEGEKSPSSDEQSGEVARNNEEKKEHEVIHKKDGRLHIYIRQDKYKGELKSKNWVGRLYIDGKQKIYSAGTPNLEEAIPILEKWFDDVHVQKEKEQPAAPEQPATPEQTTPAPEQPVMPEQTTATVEKTIEPAAVNQNLSSEPEKTEASMQTKSPSSFLWYIFINLA